ncbi:MAG: hypothetical protein E5V64_06020 [Mesorhizobium sp.]|uniref:LPD5 domain-containing protein n=1 Tax=Mesorhizobium sp. TaxID=1871066 RepID=UPI0012055D9C|nr:LPD5 domain-containing protein [Mesorhizobium sp.]TIV83892.1 MAG: hypothetical protein E5V64_06020 [Mesorhizobium sp.]
MEPAAVETAPAGALLPDHEFMTAGETNPEPTPAQAEAGNYSKRKVKVHGLDVSIENEKGGVRRSKPDAAEPWEVTMPTHYGYIRRTEGADGDQLDVYLGDHPSDKVFVVDQVDADTKAYDEHKVMIDFPSREAAVQAYEQAFSDGKGAARIGAVTEMPMFGFKQWLKSGDTTQPLSYVGPKQAVENTASPATKPPQNIPENITAPGEPSFLKEFNPQGRAAFDALQPANKDIALHLGRKIDEMRAAGDTERADRLQAKLDGIIEAIMPRNAPAEAAKPQGPIRSNGKMVTPEVARRAMKILDEGFEWDDAVAEAINRAKGGKPNKAPDYSAKRGNVVAEWSKKLPEGYTFRHEGEEVSLHDPDGRRIAYGAPDAAILKHMVSKANEESAKRPKPTDVKQRKAPTQKGPQDIIQFLASQGGVQDFKGEMRAIDAHKTFVPGSGKLVREGGVPLDTAREAAAQAGYFDHLYGDRDKASEKSTVRDLLDLVDETRRGNRQYASGEQGAAAAPEKVDRLQQEVEAHAKDHGLTLNDATTSDILGKIADGMAVDEAVAEVAERHALEFEHETHDSRGQGEPNLDDIPFDIPQAPDARAADKARQGAEDQGRDRQGPDGGAARGGEAPREQPRGSEPDGRQGEVRPTEEAGAEGKPQAVIPGAEKISQAEQAQRAADEKMKPKAPQKDAGELFDMQARSERQDDMFAAKPKAEAKPAGKIEDFGEKIAGARKDMVRDLANSLSSDVDVATEPLSKIFPQPDYEKLAEAGVNRASLAMIAVAREQIPSKPRVNYKVKRWAEQVRVLRDFANKLLTGEYSDPALLAERMRGTAYLRNIADTARMIEDLDPSVLPQAAKWQVKSGSYTRFMGYSGPAKTFYYLLDDKGRFVKNPADNTMISGETFDDIVDPARAFLRAELSKEESGAAKRQTPTGIYQDRTTKTYFIGFKGQSGVIRLKAGFETAQDARSYREEKADELQAAIDEMRSGPQMRRPQNRPREGVDRREGDVSPEQFQEAFGFRGVQFGNYVEEKRRQFELNEAFDGLMDLAEIIGVPPKALSLDGKLGLAFGARGHGNAKAHYEPTHVVINLTKPAGAGSLAHEWFHAVDDYFARQDTGRSAASVDFMTTRGESATGAVRPAVRQAFNGVRKSLTGGGYSVRMNKLDDARSKPYWNTMIEKAARGFEKYVVDRLAVQKATNDYLANIDENAGAYPTDAEMRDQGITAAFDGLFNAIETKEEGGRVPLFSRQDEGRLKMAADAIQPTDAFKAQAQAVGKRLRAELDRLGLSDIGLRISETLGLMVDGKLYPANGSYFRKLVSVALDADTNPDSILDHEAIHALRDVGAFGQDEWAILERKSRKEWRDRYEIADAYGDFSDDVQTEEGIAHAYADWRAGRSMDGIIAKAFKKIRSVLQAIARAFGRDFRTAEDVFAQVDSGEIGNRPRTVIAADRMRRVMGDGQGEERFRLRTPHDAEEAQQTMQGMIARGQPLDRALRLPFQFFGGLDERGRWKPGLRLSEQAGKIITTAKIDPKGRFGWLAGPVEAARAGLIDRYGLSPEYIERDRQRHMDERSITMQGAEVLKTLAEQNVGPNEARVLQAILTGEAVTDADMQRLAAPIRQAIDELGQEAVALGLVSPESFERNRGTYLHRVYAKHESEQNNLQKLVGQIMGRKRKQIIGNELKGRGLFWDVDNARLMKDIASFQEGQRGGPVLGEKFRVVDNVLAPTEDMLSGEERGRVARRVFLPADQDVPLKYVGQEWRDNGVWEVRKAGNGKVTLWRDYTPAERAKMGEILDARYTIGKTYLYMAHDLATGRFYKDIAENEDWTSTLEPADGTWTNPQRFGRAGGYGDYQWVRVPDEPIPSTGGKKKWGALSGKFVRTEIWRDLNEIEVMNRPSTWRMLLTQWKLNKTSRSPVVHMNNVMSNLMLMDMQDVRMQDLAAGLRSFIAKDRHWQDANAHGVFGADMMTQEIRDKVLKPILDEIERQGQDGTQESFLSRAGVLGKFADRLWTLAKTADRKMIDLYRVEDDVFRLASYQARIARGETPEHAAAAAREQFLDYDIRAPWVNAARNSLLPFISYTYRAVPLLARAIATRPWKLAKYAMIAYALNALAYAWDDDGDEDKERASLRDEEQGYTWLGTPRMLRMPWRNKDGLPVFLDARRWIPAGDVFDTNQGSSAVPVPAPLQFGGPLMLAFELALNKSGFTGDPITNDLTDNWWDKTSKTGDYLWKAWLPSAAWVPNSWYWTKIGNAINGATDAKGRPYSLPEAVSSSFGIKMKPQDVETGLFWHYKDIKDADQALRAEARTLARQRERGLISQKAFDAGMASLLDKRDLLVERVKELQKAAQRK